MSKENTKNPEPFLSKFWLAIIVAVASLVGSISANWFDAGVEYKRTVNHLTADRQNDEIKNTKQEVEKIINNYQEFLTETDIIFENLTDSRQANFERPLFGIGDVNLDQKELGKKLTRLSGDLIPALQTSYEQLVSIHGVPLSQEIISVPKGVNVIATAWFGRKGLSPEEVLPANSSSLWLPLTGIKLPPKNPEEANNLKIACLDKIKEQVKLLTESRKKIISGRFNLGR